MLVMGGMSRVVVLAGVILAMCLSSCDGLRERSARIPGEMHTRHVTVGDAQRSYNLFVPEEVKTPAPVILAFHGAGSTPEFFARQSSLHERAGQDGFIVVYPSGFRRTWNAGDCCGPAQRREIDDIAFVKAILDDLPSAIDVDPDRVYATGMSNGGRFVYRLACESTIRIAAIAPVANSRPDILCAPERPIPLLHIHGLADPSSPFEGGQGLSFFEPIPVPEAIDDWLEFNGCVKDEQAVTFERGAAKCITHPDCQDNAGVTLCTVEGMGHQWPGGEVVLPRRLGPGSTDISATNIIVQFFKQNGTPR